MDSELKSTDDPDPSAPSILSNSFEAPDTFYHYTTQQGLLGIIENRHIRATDIFYLNDATEHVYGLELLKRVLQEHLKSIPRKVSSPEYTEDNFSCGTPDPVDERKVEFFFIEDMLALFNFFEERLGSSTFISSFTAKADDLNQWRSYSGQNGFCIGFDATALSDLMDAERFSLHKCLYDEMDQREAIEECLSDCLARDQKWAEINHEEAADRAGCTTAIIELVSFIKPIPRLKHSAFKDEEEWRFVKTALTPDESIHLRQGTSMLVPYIEISLAEKDEPLSVIKEIFIGPTPHRDLAKRAVEKLLAAHGITGCEILLSNIPYRTW